MKTLSDLTLKQLVAAYIGLTGIEVGPKFFNTRSLCGALHNDLYVESRVMRSTRRQAEYCHRVLVEITLHNSVGGLRLKFVEPGSRVVGDLFRVGRLARRYCGAWHHLYKYLHNALGLSPN